MCVCVARKLARGLTELSVQPSSSERLLSEMLNRSERSRLGAALDYCWFDHPARSQGENLSLCVFLFCSCLNDSWIVF